MEARRIKLGCTGITIDWMTGPQTELCRKLLEARFDGLRMKEKKSNDQKEDEQGAATSTIEAKKNHDMEAEDGGDNTCSKGKSKDKDRSHLTREKPENAITNTETGEHSKTEGAKSNYGTEAEDRGNGAVSKDRDSQTEAAATAEEEVAGAEATTTTTATVVVETVTATDADDDQTNPPIGLVNCGNTCYANSILQALHVFPEYYQLASNQAPLLKELATTMRCLSSEARTSPAINPKHFLAELENTIREKSHTPNFKASEQQDAREILAAIMDELGDQSRQAKDLTTTTVIERKTCTTCGNKSQITRQEQILIWPIRKTLSDMAKAYAEPEMMDGENKANCDRCGTKRETTHSTNISSPPEILVIAVNRQRVNDNRRFRDNQTIEQIQELQLKVRGEDEEETTLSYRTKAVIHHKGTREAGHQERGHYTAFVAKKNEWFLCNDAQVSLADSYQLGTGSAYIVICRKEQASTRTELEDADQPYYY